MKSTLWQTKYRGNLSIDYHVEFDHHYYSVPYRFARQKVNARATSATIELFHRGSRIASHVRSTLRGRHTTVDAHMTPAHQAVQGWNAPRLMEWAGRIGPHTKAVIEHVLHQRRHPQQGYRSCLGILRLSKNYGDTRLEAACERALAVGAHRYRSVASILENGLDRQPALPPQAELALPDHANVRGPDYYH